MRVTIFGATGLLGKALIRVWDGDEVVGLGRTDADIRDVQQVRDAVRRTRPDWIVLAAAYTNVDGCEVDPRRAFDVNCGGAVNVAQAAEQAGSRLMFLSTDYVFDGGKSVPYETDDARAPRSVYGKSKAEAEIQIEKLMPRCCIARTAWLFGMAGPCFPDTILRLAAVRPEVPVVDDQRGCPTYSLDLARAIKELCHRNAEDIVHVTNRGECSWFEFAREIVDRAGLSTTVRRTTTHKMVRPAERPKYSVLSPTSLEKYGITMPSWQDALGRYMRERQG